MKYLLILIVGCTHLLAANISIRPLLAYDGSTTRLLTRPVKNCKGEITALLNENKLFSSNEKDSLKLLYTFEYNPDYVLYEESDIFVVHDTTLLHVTSKGEKRKLKIRDRVRKLCQVNDSIILLTAGYEMRLSMLYSYNLINGTVIDSFPGYGNWLLDEQFCYLIVEEKSKKTKLKQIRRKNFITKNEWDLTGRPRTLPVSDGDRIWLLTEPDTTGFNLLKLDLISIDLKSGERSIRKMPFNAGGHGDVNSDLLILKGSPFDVVIAPNGDKRLQFISMDSQDTVLPVSLSPRGGFGNYKTRALFQKGDFLYTLHGGKLATFDLKMMQLKSAMSLKDCRGIIGDNKNCFLLYHNKILRVGFKSDLIPKPLIKATPWQYGGELEWKKDKNSNPWKFGEGRATINVSFAQETLVSRITLLDCDVDSITKVTVRSKDDFIDLSNECPPTFKGDFVLPDSIAFYSSFLTIEIDTKSDSVSTIGGVSLQ